jgi:hypothetical protein
MWTLRAAVYYFVLPWLLPWFGVRTCLNPRFLPVVEGENIPDEQG